MCFGDDEATAVVLMEPNALFVAGAAFTDPVLQGQAKMGALFSGFVGLAAILLGKALGFGKQRSAASNGRNSSEAA